MSNIIPLQTNTNKPKLSPSQTFVEKWVNKHNAKLNIKTNLIEVGDEMFHIEQFVRKLNMSAEGKGTRINRNNLRDAAHCWYDDQRPLIVKSIVNSVCVEEITPETELRRFIKAVCKEEYGLNLVVMKHFIWQVKRKMLKMPVYHHLCPIFYGRTGGGKTSAINKLLECIDPVVKGNITLPDITDEKQVELYRDNYVIFLDEMSGAERTDIEVLKNRITAKDIAYRPMKSNISVSIKNNTTCIAASNKQVIDLIFDPTSARRFWQIDCLDQLDWETINSIDYMSIWHSVDPNTESPILEALEKIKAIQEDRLRNKSPLEIFIDEHCISDADNRTSGETLWDTFKRFCEANRLNPGNNQKFLRELKPYRIKTGGVNKYKLNLKTAEDYGSELPSWLMIQG